MNFLEAIDGKYGEELTSACLAFLLDHSPEIRKSVLGEMVRVQAINDTSTDTHFLVRPEFPTVDADSNDRGSLDVLVETDDCIIGIENKLDAGFTKEQPFKYMNTLERLASERKVSSGGSIRAELVVLAPAWRREEIEKHLRGAVKHIRFIAWEGILKALQDTPEQSSRIAVIRDELSAYIMGRIEFFTDFANKLESLARPITSTANDTQGALLRRVWEIFRPTTKYEGMSYRPHPAKNASYGGYFLRGAVDLGWYGFVNDERLGLNNGGAKFAIGLQEPLTSRLRMESFAADWEVHKSESPPPGWGPNWSVWAFTLGLDCQNPKKWESLVAPIHVAVESLPEKDRLGVYGRVPNSPP